MRGFDLWPAARCIVLAHEKLLFSRTTGDRHRPVEQVRDRAYPPAEFYTATRRGGGELAKKLVGADIDIGTTVAKRLRGHAEFVTMPFADVIPSLLDKKCDAIISFIKDTAGRSTCSGYVSCRPDRLGDERAASCHPAGSHLADVS